MWNKLLELNNYRGRIEYVTADSFVTNHKISSML